MSKKKKVMKRIGNVYIGVGVVLILASIALLAYPQLPYIFNALELNTPDQEVENITQPVYQEEDTDVTGDTKVNVKTLPDKDSTLPTTNRIIIPSIGVNAQIIEGEDSKQALYSGPWRVPDYATPESNYLEQTSKSIIIASHRFGYSSWGKEKRDLISFFHLPETKVGDTVVLQWNQREYVYQITDIDEDVYIKPIEADLILYTCKYFNSDIRIFRFANLISINDIPVD